MEKIIYERHYPKEELPGFDPPETNELTEEEHKAAAEFFRELELSRVRVLLPERALGAVYFKKAAIGVSELYELDLKLVERDSHISATLSFDCGGSMSALHPLLALGDDYSFFKDIFDRDITICVDYYTHAEFRKGRKKAPLSWSFE